MKTFAEATEVTDIAPRKRKRPDRAVKIEESKKTHKLTVKCFLGGYQTPGKKKSKGSRSNNPTWKGLCKQPVMAAAIDRAVQYISSVTIMASRLLVYHTLRALQANRPIQSSTDVYNDLISKVFIAAGNIVKRQGGAGKYHKDNDIQESAAAFANLLRTSTIDGEHIQYPAYESWMADVQAEAARQFSVNVKNHLHGNASAFIRRLVAARISGLLPDSTMSTRKVIKSATAAAYKSLTEQTRFSETIQAFRRLKNLPQAELNIVQNIIDDIEPVYAPIRAGDKTLWFWNHTRLFHFILAEIEAINEDSLNRRMVHDFMQSIVDRICEVDTLMDQMLSEMEINQDHTMSSDAIELDNAQPLNIMQYKVFDILPISKLRAKYIRLTNTSLAALVHQLAQLSKTGAPLQRKQRGHGVPCDDSDIAHFRAIVEEANAQANDPSASKEDRMNLYWSKCFEIRRHERSNKLKFANVLETDGIGVSLTMSKQKTDAELDIIEKKAIVAADKKRHKDENAARRAAGQQPINRKKNAEEIALQQIEEDAKEASLKEAAQLLGFSKDEDGVWKIKDGAFAPVGIDPGKKKPFTCATWSAAAEQSLWKQDGDKIGSPSDENERFSMAEMSKSEYYYLSGFNQRAAITNKHIEACPRVKEYNQGGALSTKSASLHQYEAAMIPFARIYNTAMELYSTSRWWRRLKMGTYIKGQKTMEIILERITKQKDPILQKKVVVAFGDASIGQVKGCAPVGNKKIRSFIKERTCCIYTSEFRTSKCCSCCHKPLGGALYKVRRCRNNVCHRTLWGRDSNAAINILFRLLWEIRDEEIPGVFCRGTVLEEAEEDPVEEEDNTRVEEIILLHA